LKIKTLKEDSYFRDAVKYAGYFNSVINELKEKVEALSKIEI
jgi:hypothetical protein